eukprot:Skav218773  [mRNA]  locus=scaffold1372:350696:362053:- [translate_table: standard]
MVDEGTEVSLAQKRRRTGESLKFHAALPGGQGETVSVSQFATIGDLKKAVQKALGRPFLKLAAPDGRLLDDPVESLEVSGLRDGDAISVVAQQQPKVAATRGAFALWRSACDGVVTWGDPNCGGDSSPVQNRLRNVQQIFASSSAFAAILGDRSVVTWGCQQDGGDISAVRDRLKNVWQIHAAKKAFSAILADGSVLTWGHPECGGDSSAVQDQLKNVQSICAANQAFAAILADGSVVTWGRQNHGGDSSGVRDQLRNVQQICSAGYTFAAVLADGSVVTWGSRGGSRVQDQLRNVQHICATESAFAAILADRSVAVSLLSMDPAVLEVTKQLESVAEEPWLRIAAKPMVAPWGAHLEAKHFLTPAAAGAVAMLRGPNYEQQSGGELREAEESQKQSHSALLQQLRSEEAKMASTEEELVTRKSQLKKAKSDLDSESGLGKSLLEFAGESALKAEAEKVLVQKTTAFEDGLLAPVEMAVKPDPMLPAEAVALLRRAALHAHSARLGHAATVAATAPFAKAETWAKIGRVFIQLVIEEIETMQKAGNANGGAPEDSGLLACCLWRSLCSSYVIQAEGQADAKKSTWCTEAGNVHQGAMGQHPPSHELQELSKNAAGQKVKTGQMDTLNSAITELHSTIQGVDGLQATMKQAEEDLKKNEEDQEEITSSRSSENRNYQKKVQDLQDAQKLLKTAMTVLQQYYTKAALLQGESMSQGGSEVLKLLQSVLEDTKSQEDAAHKRESEAQASFEENLELLTKSQRDGRRESGDE